MIKTLKYFLFSSILSSFVVAPLLHAQEQDPYKVVQKTTEDVLAIIKDAKGYYQTDPQRFNNEVTAVMEKVVDFDDFSRGVMGSYASERRFQSLKTDAEKTAFRERIQRFSTTFKKGLVETYGNGLLRFNGEKIQTLPPRKGDNPASGSVSVVQNVYNSSGKPYTVQYSMRRNKAGEWKLYNVIIEGINLGLTYRNQFAAAAEQNRGDLDKVIANWDVEPAAIEKIKPGAAAEPVNTDPAKKEPATKASNNNEKDQ